MPHPQLLLLFDIDGTLLRVKPGLSRQVFLETLARCHQLESVELEEGYTFHGRTDRSIYADVCRFNGVDDTRRQREEENFVTSLVAEWRKVLDVETVMLLDGVLEILDDLEEDGKDILSLLTGNVIDGARAKLDPHRLSGRFVGGAFGSDSPDRNELPLIALRRISEMIGHRFEPERAVIIGDSPRDIECARRNGLHVVAVATGGSGPDELSGHRPDLLLESLGERERFFNYLDQIR